MKKLTEQAIKSLLHNISEIEKLLIFLREKLTDEKDNSGTFKAADMIILISKVTQAAADYAIKTQEIALTALIEGSPPDNILEEIKEFFH